VHLLLFNTRANQRFKPSIVHHLYH